MKSNIYLIGMMGSGKSTIGKMLTEKINAEFIDTDQKIEEFMNMSITEIFNSFGESKFREMEESYFAEKSQTNGLIFSTGGGIILSQKNRDILKKSKFTIYLKAQPKILAKRVQKKQFKRPLLNTNIPIIDKLTEIYMERNHFYEQSSNFVIETDNLSKEEKFNEVIACLP